MSFERTVLAPGIRVLTERVPGQRSATVGVWSSRGSRDESAQMAGAGHFLEHLVFKGTPSRSALDIAVEFDRNGGELNAFTNKDHTCFHARVLSSDVPPAIETIADMLQNATLVPADVEAERSVVLEEIALHADTPDDIVHDVFAEALWPGDPLGRRIEGFAETVAALGRDGLVAAYARQYEDIVVAAAGAVDHEEIAGVVARAFGNRARDVFVRPGVVPTATEGFIDIRERDVEQAHVVFGTQGIPRGDDRRWALSVLNVALGGGLSSRLFQEIRERRGLAYSVSSGHQGFAETGVFTVYAGCSVENVSEVLRIMRDIVGTVASDGITEEEHARATSHLRGSILLGLDEPGTLVTHLGKGELLYGEILTPEDMIARIEAVTLDDLRAVAGSLLGARPWSLAVVGPRLREDLSEFVGVAA